jgi:NAD(P)H dehydrogenase (quinone)
LAERFRVVRVVLLGRGSAPEGKHMSNAISGASDTERSGGQPRVLIVVDSWQGHTARVAEHVADGARSVGGVVTMRSSDAATRADLLATDALVMGSAVHQRGMTWKMKRFVDEVCEPAWFYDDLVGLVGAVFTTGGGSGDAGGGAEAAQLDMLINLAACGMILVPLPKDTPGFGAGGTQWGPTIKTTTEAMQPIDPDHLDPALQLAFFHHGANIVRVAARLNGLALAAANHMPTPGVRAERLAAEQHHPLNTRWGHLADPEGSCR